MSETLHTCAKCGRTNFTARGLKTHRCDNSSERNERPVLNRKTDSLALHPLLERVTMMRDVVDGLQKQKVKKPEHVTAAEEIEADLSAFEASLDEVGILDPLKVTRKGEVADGRTRLQWAMRRGIKTVPCMVVSDEEAVRIIETMMIARRQLTKGMKAYAAVLLHPEVATTTKGAGMQKRSYSVGTLTREDLAHKFGVSLPLIDQACKLYSAFDASKTLREKHEKLVWAGFGLGAIFAGLHGAARVDVTIQDHERVNGIFKRLTSFSGSLATDWEKFEAPEQRETITDAVTNFLSRLPAELRDAALTKLPNWEAGTRELNASAEN